MGQSCAAELLVHEHAEQGGHEQRATAQRVANSVAKTVTSAGVAEVAEGEEPGRPDGGPALRPGGAEVVLPAALGALERVTHHDAKNEGTWGARLGEGEDDDDGGERDDLEDALWVRGRGEEHVGREREHARGVLAHGSAGRVEDIADGGGDAQRDERLHGELPGEETARSLPASSAPPPPAAS